MRGIPSSRVEIGNGDLGRYDKQLACLLFHIPEFLIICKASVSSNSIPFLLHGSRRQR